MRRAAHRIPFRATSGSVQNRVKLSFSASIPFCSTHANRVIDTYQTLNFDEVSNMATYPKAGHICLSTLQASFYLWEGRPLMVMALWMCMILVAVMLLHCSVTLMILSAAFRDLESGGFLMELIFLLVLVWEVVLVSVGTEDKVLFVYNDSTLHQKEDVSAVICWGAQLMSTSVSISIDIRGGEWTGNDRIHLCYSCVLTTYYFNNMGFPVHPPIPPPLLSMV